MTPKYTLAYAQKMLNLCLEAQEKILSGAVHSYTIGSRALTYLDLKEIQAMIDYWSKMVDALNGTYSTRHTRQVVPRDL